jgi:hypothetical protein
MMAQEIYKGEGMLDVFNINDAIFLMLFLNFPIYPKELFRRTQQIRLMCLLIFCLNMSGCSKPSDPAPMNKIELKNGQLHATFVMPATYKVERGTEALMVFRVKYPDMEPSDPNSTPRDDEIDVYITLLDRPGWVEQMVESAANHFDSSRPGRIYRAGKQGPYTLYRSTAGSVKNAQTEITTYVFRAKDGALVGAEDPGSWSVKYKVDRKIGANLQIKYLISKPLGRNFIEIDERVVTFINNYLKTPQDKG